MTKSFVLWQSGIASLVIAVILVVTVVVVVDRAGRWTWRRRVQPGKDWDFSESWASSATLGASAFAAFFGSTDVVVALEGDKATVAPVIVVASAIALGLIIVAPLVVKACSSSDGEASAAIAVAAAITVCAALFEGIVIVWLAKDLPELGVWGNWPMKLAGFATACLLLTYVFRSLRGLLRSPTPSEVAALSADAARKAQAAAIAQAIAEAHAVAAAQAESAAVYAQSRHEAGFTAQADVAAARSALEVAKAAAQDAEHTAEEAASLAANAASNVAPSRRATVL